MGDQRTTGPAGVEQEQLVRRPDDMGGGAAVMRHATADVGVSREALRRKRLVTLLVVVGIPTAFLWYRILSGNPFNLFNLPSIDPLLLIPSLFFLLLIFIILGQFVFTGRSPHVMYRPEQIDIRLDDVKGIDARQGGRGPLAQPLPRAQDVRQRDGRHPSSRPALRGRARAPARPTWPRRWRREAGVPFLFVSRHVVPVDVLRRDRHARSAPTSRRCARRLARRAARSASSRRSTRSPWPAAGSAPRRCLQARPHDRRPRTAAA